MSEKRPNNLRTSDQKRIWGCLPAPSTVVDKFRPPTPPADDKSQGDPHERKPTTSSLSSAEAEYFGAMMAARDLVFIRDLLADLAITLDGPCVVWSDSRSAVALAFDPVAFKQTKHILRAAEFLRDLVAKNVITLQHLPGRVMIADTVTKAVSRPVFLALLKLFDAYAVNGVVCPT